MAITYHGRIDHDQGKEIAGWRKMFKALGMPPDNPKLDCDRLIARRRGIDVNALLIEQAGKKL